MVVAVVSEFGVPLVDPLASVVSWEEVFKSAEAIVPVLSKSILEVVNCAVHLVAIVGPQLREDHRVVPSPHIEVGPILLIVVLIPYLVVSSPLRLVKAPLRQANLPEVPLTVPELIRPVHILLIPIVHSLFERFKIEASLLTRIVPLVEFGIWGGITLGLALALIERAVEVLGKGVQVGALIVAGDVLLWDVGLRRDRVELEGRDGDVEGTGLAPLALVVLGTGRG
jgi:hypothetical protein